MAPHVGENLSLSDLWSRPPFESRFTQNSSSALTPKSTHRAEDRVDRKMRCTLQYLTEPLDSGQI